MKEEEIQLLKNLAKRVEYIESLESIQHPTHLKELIVDLMERVDELDFQRKVDKELY